MSSKQVMKTSRKPREDGAVRPQLKTALKLIIVLLTLVLCQAMALVWLWPRHKSAGEKRSFILWHSAKDNVVRRAFPKVDFSSIYPGLSETEIDSLQRECFSLRYVYSPFVEFEPLPVAGRFINVSPAGFRNGSSPVSWPPSKDEFVVFVFGGSTTFGFGLPDAQTLVSALEEELAKSISGRKVRCYNFGRGYYFSTQERLLFESLLERGHVPNVALFIDGLNDFQYFDGLPELTPDLFSFIAPDLPAPRQPDLADERVRADAVEHLLGRYRQNVRMTEGLAQACGVSAIFVGQPVPFLDFPRTPSTYPFRKAFSGHDLCEWGYGRFKQASLDGRFGNRFIWCGDAFSRAESIMYADSIHYSAAGAKTLASTIVERAGQKGLLR